MAGSRGARLGPALYRAMDGRSDLAAIIVLIDHHDGVELCNVVVFDPQTGHSQLYRRVRFDQNAGPATALAGTCYCW